MTLPNQDDMTPHGESRTPRQCSQAQPDPQNTDQNDRQAQAGHQHPTHNRHSPHTERQMPINRLRMRNYRSIRDLDLRLDSVTILTGPNGAGKTNILSAIDELRRNTYSSASNGIREAVNQHCNTLLSMEFQHSNSDDPMEWTLTNRPGDRGTLAMKATGQEVQGKKRQKALAQGKRIGLLNEESHHTNGYSMQDLEEAARITGWRPRQQDQAPHNTQGQIPTNACVRMANLIAAVRRWRCVLLDNPDAGLHHTAVVRLAEFLQSQDDQQFIVVTHSTTLIANMGITPERLVHVTNSPQGNDTRAARETHP